MEFKELVVPQRLQNSIRGIWYRRMDFGCAPTAFEILPDGHAEIVFHFGSGCSLVQQDRTEPLPSPFIVGLLGKPIYFQAKDCLQVIGIKCLPWAVYDLLGLTATKGGITSFSHPIANLQCDLDELLQSGKVDDALALTMNWLLNTGEPTIPIAALRKAGQAMLESNGSMPIKSVAAAANATVRTLERKFKASSGHTVKNVSGLIRFETVRDTLWERPESAISALAYDLGYADQSHLNREFKRYCGITATAFAKQTINRKKELTGDFVAIVLSS